MNREPHHAPPASSGEDIAIVGMACLVPGADTLGQYWRNIVHGVDCITDPPPEWREDRNCNQNAASEPIYTGKGGYLGDFCRFTPTKYGVMPSGVDGAEPDQFLALRCAFEALADAGVPKLPVNREKTAVILGRGVFLNRGSLNWFQHGFVIDQVVQLLQQLEPDRSPEDLLLLRDELKRNLPAFTAELVPGLAHCVLTGRIANRLNLKGPAYTLDAACSSALIAVEHGLRELRSGTCDVVLAGGVQVSTPALVHQLFCKINALSRDGRIAPFSAEANGTLLGEGCGILVLKRRSDAERDGHRIYALVKGVGISSDGTGAGLLSPQGSGQQLAIRRAYEQTGLPPQSIALLEAHGTGIPLGDRTETGSLAAVFGPRNTAKPTIALGTVKSMIGHLVPASGAASLIKTTLALYHRTVPPTLHAENASPLLGLDNSRFYLSTRLRPWIHGDLDQPRRAGVNAFGFGGINAHAILEEYPEAASAPVDYDSQWPAELVVVSALGPAALSERAQSLAEWIERSADVSLLDVAASCAVLTGPSRLAVIAKDLEELKKKLRHAAKLLIEPGRERIQDRSGIFWYREPLARQGRVAFLFPGAGAQYPDMLQDLCRHFGEVRRQFDIADAAYQRLQAPVPLSRLIYSLPDEAREAETKLMGAPERTISVMTAERGLLALLERLGVKADAVCGHSNGEFVAFQAARAFASTDDEQLVQSLVESAQLDSRFDQPNLVGNVVLTAVGGTSPQAIQDAIEQSHGRLSVAIDNCPHQVVIAGDEAATNEALERLRGKGGLCERLPVKALHTPAFAPACQILDGYFQSIKLGVPQVELWSCALADRYPTDAESVTALAVRQLQSPLRFRETVEAMHAAGVRVFLEVGPRGNLSAFVADTLGKKPHAAIPLDLHRQSGLEQFSRAVGLLIAHGVDVNLSALYEPRHPRIHNLSAEPPPPPVREQPLSQGLPDLTVSESFLEKFRRKAPPAAVTVLERFEPPAPPTVPMHAPAAPPPPTRSNGHGIVERLPQRTATVVPATAPVSSDRRAFALNEYQQVMQQFLQTQERVTLARLQAGYQRAAPATNGTYADVAAPVLAYTNGHSAGPAMEVASPNLRVAADIQALRHPVPPPPAPPPVAPPPSPAPLAASIAKQEPVRERTPTLPIPAPTPAQPRSLSDQLIQIVSDRTGYPKEMLNLDASLEGDLGIDSIKRVEILGAFRRTVMSTGQEPSAALLERLSLAKSLRAIVAVMEEGSTGGTPPQSVAPAVKYAFIDRVLSHDPGGRIVAECDFDVARHGLLRDHAFFGRDLSVRDPSLYGVPIMPLAVTLEVMAEAAALLAPERQVVGLRNVQTRRWLSFEQPTRRVRVEAAVLDDATIRCAAHDLSDASEAVIAEALVEVADRPRDLGTPVVADTTSGPFPWPQADIYGRMLYHGKTFEGIVTGESCTPTAVRATISEPDPALLEEGRGRLVLPVALIDLAGQFVGLVIRHTWDGTDVQLVFPNTIDRLEFAGTPARDRKLLALANVQHSSTAIMANTEFRTETGQVALRSLNSSQEVVSLPAEIYAYASAARQMRMTVDVTDLFAGVPGIEACRVAAASEALGRSLVKRPWTQVFASLILSRSERSSYAELKLPPVNLATWLTARAAAKDAVRQQAQLDECLADVIVNDDTNGQVTATLPDRPAPLVALSQTGFVAMAVAADKAVVRGVGLAIEPAAPLDDARLADAFDERELQLIDQAARQSGEAIVLWQRSALAAKAAVAQALGQNIAGCQRQLAVVKLDVVMGRVDVRERSSSAALPGAYRRMHDGQVVALCLWRQGDEMRKVKP